ncbi:hybrid sensor histidine kinase/response regulator transcription factor [Flammeovirga aprica]|uniref:histidine kinase n=1 Tax=Flammeovirga aprica JL-4 TaxID=694437 RepID=A0A7X9XAY0_9BACT|nr:ATP-binding protein [Flammeovirga aprica]NME70151.1 response regulator [Flammeovirga aprica JL-4]
MFSRKLCILFTVFTLSISSVFSQNFFERINDKDGLNQNTIIDIHQDKSGFIWMGTPNGLIRYDGNKFISYNNQPGDETSIIGNTVNFIYDNGESLWLETNDGFSVYSFAHNSFSEIKEFSKYIKKGHKVRAIIPLADQTKWMVTSKGILRIKEIGNTYKVTEVDLSSILTNNDHPILSVQNHNNRFYMCTSQELYIFDRVEAGTLKLIEVIHKDTYHLNWFIELTLDQENEKLYVTGRKSLLAFDISWEKAKLLKLDFFDEHFKRYDVGAITTSVKDHEGNLWIGMRNGGAMKYNTKTFKKQFYVNSDNPKSISSNIILDIMIDRFGTIWFGTGLGGVSILNTHQRLFYTLSNTTKIEKSLSSNRISSSLVDSKGHLWAGTFQSGINRSKEQFSLANIDELSFEYFIEQAQIFDIIECNEQIFIGTNKGLYIYDLNSERLISPKNQPPYLKNINSFEKLDDKLIFYANGKLLALHLQKKITSEKKLSFEDIGAKIVNFSVLNNIQVNQIYNDGVKGILLATDQGLFHLDTTFTYLTQYKTNVKDNTSIGANRILSIYRSQKNELWIGTFGGGLNLAIEKENKIDGFSRITKKDGLLDNMVYGILEDKEGNIWLTNNNGVTKYNAKEKQLKVFNNSVELLANNMQKGVFFKDKYGIMFFTTLKGLTVFNPMDIKPIPFAPLPQITQFKVRNEVIEPNKKYDGEILLNTSIDRASKIVLPSDMNQIILEVGTIFNGGRNNIKYAYRLKGVDDDWVMKDFKQREISYAGLSPGKYQLEIKGYNGDGMESETVKTLTIIIEHPWYANNYAYTVYLLLLFLLCFICFTYFTKMWKLKQKVRKEQRDKKHLKEINEAKLTFFTNVSHELRTPLTLILTPLEKLAYDDRLDDDLKGYVQNINKNGQRLMSLTNSLIDFKQNGKDDFEINLTEQNIIPFIKKTTNAFQDYSKDKNITFKVDLNKNDIIGQFDQVLLERIIFNLLSNAFKYTENGGEVSFSAHQVKGDLVFKIQDTGIGIDEGKLDHIFDNFYKANNMETVFGSSGIGLFLVKQLVDLHDGEIKVDSKIHKGTTFTVRIPVLGYDENRKAFDQRTEEPVPLLSAIDEGKPKILLVEDNAELRKMIYELFKSKYQLYLAENGVEGYDLAVEVAPDLVILDVNMPKMNGYELADKLKGNYATNHIPMIFLTAMVDFESKKKIFEKGGQVHIGKPFSPYVLELQVDNLIKQKKDGITKLKQDIKSNPKKEQQLTEDEKWLKGVQKIMEENYGENKYGVKSLAESLDMNYVQFYSKFKEITGQSPIEYLKLFRLKKAEHLFKNDDGLSVREVIYQVGFKSSSYFTHIFKDEYKMTPTQFKKMHSN